MQSEPIIPHEDPVARLWSQCCGGSKEAMSQIAGYCYESLYHYGTKFTDDRELIKDCLQDLFLDIWEKRDRLRTIVNPRSYLFQAFRNNLLHRIKKAVRYTGIEPVNAEELSTFSYEAEWISREAKNALDQRLRQTLERLPRRQREALYLRYYENLSYEEIAEVMGLRRQAVANYLQYGIQKLRDYWQQVVVSIFLFLV